jgi:hypothetical protein
MQETRRKIQGQQVSQQLVSRHVCGWHQAERQASTLQLRAGSFN